MISSATARARSTGTAKLRPTLPGLVWPEGLGTLAPAVLTPISRPPQSTSGPPLLPGLIDASVCTAPMSRAVTPLPAGTSTVRSSAATMPAVTVLDRPSGAPSATTGCPTRTSSELPRGIGVTWWSVSTSSTARSVSGSRPTIVAGTVTESSNWTSTSPSGAATEITWSFVMMWPSVRMIAPEPVPPPLLAPRAKIVTTDGRVRSATPME